MIIAPEGDSKEGVYRIHWEIPGNLLNANIYTVNINFGESLKYLLYKATNALSFEISNFNYDNELTNKVVPGVIKPELATRIEYVEGEI